MAQKLESLLRQLSVGYKDYALMTPKLRRRLLKRARRRARNIRKAKPSLHDKLRGQ